MGATGTVLEFGLVIEELVEPARHRRVESLLRQGERFGGAAGKRLRELPPFSGELGIGPHPGDETDPQRFVRAHGLARQHQVERAAPTHQAREEERRARVGHEPDPSPAGAEGGR